MLTFGLFQITMTGKMMLAALLIVALVAPTIAHCPTSCECNDETLIVTCVKANLEVVPITLNPSIQTLNLRENKIKTATSFVFYASLHYLDLSHNELFNIPSKCFESQKELEELHLNNNRLSSLTNFTFVGLKSLKILNLRHNYLLDLPDRFFRHLTQLKELDLGQNRISRIDPAAFENLASLRVLYLHDNQLKSVPTLAFSQLGSLAVLHIGLNSFSTLPDDAFSSLQRLSELNLSGAGLSNISENALRGIAALRNLVLTDNQLTAVPSRVLSKLNRLEELSLGQNLFTAVTSGCLDGLVHLQRLDITGAQELVRIETGAFANNLNIRTIILNSNKRLEAIQDGALTGLPNLKELSLRANAFRSFSESMVAWPELTKLDVSENPLVCDCSVLWLRDLLLRRNASHVRCTAPARVEDRFLHALAPDELGCALRSARQQAVIGAICGSVVAIIAVLSILLYRYRRRLQDMVKEYKWNKRAISRKEHEYQKTFSDEDYIVRAAQQQQTLKPIPVTEL